MQPRQLTSISNFDQSFPAFAIRLLNAKKNLNDQITFLNLLLRRKGQLKKFTI